MTPREAASAALEAHDALCSAYDLEPELDSEGMPLNTEAWQHWHHTVTTPAYKRWSDVMDALSATLGYEVGRHPLTFRPICEALLGREVSA
jgi:hypothetical protein